MFIYSKAYNVFYTAISSQFLHVHYQVTYNLYLNISATNLTASMVVNFLATPAFSPTITAAPSFTSKTDHFLDPITFLHPNVVHHSCFDGLFDTKCISFWYVFCMAYLTYTQTPHYNRPTLSPFGSLKVWMLFYNWLTIIISIFLSLSKTLLHQKSTRV